MMRLWRRQWRELPTAGAAWRPMDLRRRKYHYFVTPAATRPTPDLRRRKYHDFEFTVREVALVAVMGALLWVGLSTPAVCAATAASASPTAAAAPRRLPPWTGRVLRSDERVARFDTCGADCFLIFTCTEADTLAGRLIRATRRRRMIAYSEQYAWLQSDLACPGDVVRVKNAIPLTDARAVLDAVRPHMLEGEQVGEIHALGSVRLEDGQPVEYGASEAIGVSLRCPGTTGGRELTVRREPGGLVVELKGIRPD